MVPPSIDSIPNINPAIGTPVCCNGILFVAAFSTVFVVGFVGFIGLIGSTGFIESVVVFIVIGITLVYLG
jgi:hypothetical protein